MTSRKKIILEVRGLSKSFRQGDNTIKILDDANLTIYENEVVAVVGPSGCGKTTFLQIIGLLDDPISGDIIIDGDNLTEKSDSYKTSYRRNNMGFVYQSHNLLGDFTAFDNVKLPLLLKSQNTKEEIDSLVFDILSKLGLENKRNSFPSYLSGGEQQRVAIARALVHDPIMLLADEPTGNLDPDNAKKVIDLLLALLKKRKKSLIIVTHNLEIAKKADRVITIEKGKIVERKSL